MLGDAATASIGKAGQASRHVLASDSKPAREGAGFHREGAMTCYERAVRLSERQGRQVWVWFDLTQLRMHATLSVRPGRAVRLIAIVIGREVIHAG